MHFYSPLSHNISPPKSCALFCFLQWFKSFIVNLLNLISKQMHSKTHSAGPFYKYRCRRSVPKTASDSDEIGNTLPSESVKLFNAKRGVNTYIVKI